jgi:hypothetical protein
MASRSGRPPVETDAPLHNEPNYLIIIAEPALCADFTTF